MLSGCAHARGARPRADRLCASARRLSRGRPEANAVHQATRWSWRGERASGRRGCTPTARYEAGVLCAGVCDGGRRRRVCVVPSADLICSSMCGLCAVINEIAISFQEIPNNACGVYSRTSNEMAVVSAGYHPSVEKAHASLARERWLSPLRGKNHKSPRCIYQARTPLYRSSPRGAGALMPFGPHASFPRLNVCYAQNPYAARKGSRESASDASPALSPSAQNQAHVHPCRQAPLSAAAAAARGERRVPTRIRS